MCWTRNWRSAATTSCVMPMIATSMWCFSSRVARFAGCIPVDVAALQQIIQSTNAIPAIAVALYHERVSPAFVRVAVVFAQQVYQQLSCVAAKPDGESNLARVLIEIVYKQHRVVSPVVADDQDRRIARSDDLK